MQPSVSVNHIKYYTDSCLLNWMWIRQLMHIMAHWAAVLLTSGEETFIILSSPVTLTSSVRGGLLAEPPGQVCNFLLHKVWLAASVCSFFSHSYIINRLLCSLNYEKDCHTCLRSLCPELDLRSRCAQTDENRPLSVSTWSLSLHQTPVLAADNYLPWFNTAMDDHNNACGYIMFASCKKHNAAAWQL